MRLLFFLFLLPLALHAAGPVEVATIRPRLTTDSSEIPLFGRTEPAREATLFTRATGIVSERRADIGDVVKAGGILAVVDAPDLDRSIDAARASVEKAAAEETNSRAMAERTESLLAARAVSREEADQRANTLAAGSAALRLAQAQLARLETERGFATVRAPFDGIITARNFDIGDRTRGDSSGADEWLYRLTRTDSLRFVIAAPPFLGLRFTKETTAAVTFPEFPGKTHIARFSRSSRSFDAASGTMRAEFLLENRDLSLPAGLSGTATLVMPPPPDTFILPTNTVILREGISKLMIVRDGKAAFADAVQGRNFGRELEITSAALTPETEVVINPNALIKEGDPLTIK